MDRHSIQRTVFFSLSPSLLIHTHTHTRAVWCGFEHDPSFHYDFPTVIYAMQVRRKWGTMQNHFFTSCGPPSSRRVYMMIMMMILPLILQRDTEEDEAWMPTQCVYIHTHRPKRLTTTTMAHKKCISNFIHALWCVGNAICHSNTDSAREIRGHAVNCYTRYVYYTSLLAHISTTHLFFKCTTLFYDVYV